MKYTVRMHAAASEVRWPDRGVGTRDATINSCGGGARPICAALAIGLSLGLEGLQVRDTPIRSPSFETQKGKSSGIRTLVARPHLNDSAKREASSRNTGRRGAFATTLGSSRTASALSGARAVFGPSAKRKPR
jgi:hypothetical protein